MHVQLLQSVGGHTLPEKHMQPCTDGACTKHASTGMANLSVQHLLALPERALGAQWGRGAPRSQLATPAPGPPVHQTGHQASHVVTLQQVYIRCDLRVCTRNTSLGQQLVNASKQYASTHMRRLSHSASNTCQPYSGWPWCLPAAWSPHIPEAAPHQRRLLSPAAASALIRSAAAPHSELVAGPAASCTQQTEGKQVEGLRLLSATSTLQSWKGGINPVQSSLSVLTAPARCMEGDPSNVVQVAMCDQHCKRHTGKLVVSLNM